MLLRATRCVGSYRSGCARTPWPRGPCREYDSTRRTVRARAEARRRGTMQIQSPQEVQGILLSRPGWSEGWTRSAAGRELGVHWVGALIWNVLGIPVGWIALFGEKELGLYLTFLLPAFTLVGFLLLAMAIRETLRWRRFRGIRVELDPRVGSVGGHVGGSLELPVHRVDDIDARVLLVCIRDRLQKTSDGSSRKESVEWAEEMLPEVERSGRGMGLRFTFQVPADLPPTAERSDDYHKWVVRVQGDLPGADLDQAFEVPVLLLDPVQYAGRAALAEPSRVEAAYLPASVVRMKRRGSSLILHYPVGRGGLAGVMLSIFGAVFTGAGVFFFETIREMMDGSVFGVVAVGFTAIFLVTFGGVGLLMMLLGLYSLMNSLVVEIRNGKISTRRWFLLPVTRSARIEEVERVEMDVSSRVGDGAKAERKVRIRAFLKSGGRLSLGDDIPWGQPAEAPATLMGEELGIPVDFVKSPKLRRRA